MPFGEFEVILDPTMPEGQVLITPWKESPMTEPRDPQLLSDLEQVCSQMAAYELLERQEDSLADLRAEMARRLYDALMGHSGVLRALLESFDHHYETPRVLALLRQIDKMQYQRTEVLKFCVSAEAGLELLSTEGIRQLLELGAR